jgi:hypothetical protein
MWATINRKLEKKVKKKNWLYKNLSQCAKIIKEKQLVRTW